jgi:hypothetical protein
MNIEEMHAMKPEDIASKLFDKSLAFLEGAIATSKASDLSMFKTSEYSTVTAHLLHHAIELFLKFSIVAQGQSPKNQHNIQELYTEYKQLYKDDAFDLQIPFKDKPQYIGMTNEKITEYKSNFPMSMELQLRYPVGKKGEPYSPIMSFDTGYLESCKKKFLSLRCSILPCEEVSE